MIWHINRPELTNLTYLVSAPSTIDNKFSRGVLGVIAGSNSYPGAALLNVSAAIRTGAGLVRFLGDSSLAKSILIERPEVVFKDGEVDCYLIGSGIDPAEIPEVTVAMISEAINSERPLIIDAGALSFIQVNRKFQLITPHAGELSRLLNLFEVDVSSAEIAASPLDHAQVAAEKLKTDVLLKGSTTVIASYRLGVCYQISNLNPWLATAGAGDVLAGIIAGLVVQQSELSDQNFLDCAALGVMIHSRAADQASGGGPIAANDLVAEIPRVVAQILATN